MFNFTSPAHLEGEGQEYLAALVSTFLDVLCHMDSACTSTGRRSLEAYQAIFIHNASPWRVITFEEFEIFLHALLSFFNHKAKKVSQRPCDKAVGRVCLLSHKKKFHFTCEVGACRAQ